MSKRKRKQDRTRLYNILDSEGDHHDYAGAWFVLWPTRDPIAWRALQYYASITPNAEQERAINQWLWDHPCPGEPAVEQMEMEL